MQDRIQELTDKIYREGVEQAEQRAQQILEDAGEKARGLVDEAREQAAAIIVAAQQQAAALRQQTEAEMRLSARQAVGALKQQIADLIVWEVNHEPVAQAFEDRLFVQQIIGKLVDYWLAKSGDEQRLHILLPPDEYDAYLQFIETRAGAALKRSISAAPKAGIARGFQVEVLDRGFRIGFTDADFEQYFRAFARPRIYQLLFEHNA